MAQRSELFAQFAVVVDFSVKHQNGIPVFAAHRLRTRDEVNNREANRPEGNILGFVNILLVGAAVNQAGCGSPNELGAYKTVFMGETDDAAHAIYMVTAEQDAWKAGRISPTERLPLLDVLHRLRLIGSSR